MRRSLLLSTAALGIAILPLGAAQAQGPTPFDNAAFYFGPYVGGASSHFTTEEGGIVEATGNLNAFTAGAIFGYQFQRPPGSMWSMAVEGEVGFFGNHHEAVFDAAPDAALEVAPLAAEQVVLLDNSVDICGYDQKSVERLRFVAGPHSDNVQLILAAGLAVTNADVCYYDVGYLGGTYVGLTLGAGANIALGPNFFIRPEVLYDIYGKKNYGAVSVGVNTFTARLAAMFRFGAPSP
jgi:opacity protein-like surface antigen